MLWPTRHAVPRNMDCSQKDHRRVTIPPRGIVDAGEEVPMNHVHQHPDSAFDEPLADTDQHAAHSPATAHDHHTPTGAGHSGHAGHDKHAGHDPEMFRRRFWLTLALTIPLVVTSEMVMGWFGYSVDLPLMDWYGPVLGSIVFWWGGWPFLAGGVAEVRERQPGM